MKSLDLFLKTQDFAFLLMSLRDSRVMKANLSMENGISSHKFIISTKSRLVINPPPDFALLIKRLHDSWDRGLALISLNFDV